jgi:hypothetical protein
MTIEFNCPKCKALIAFPDKHAGKRAKCLTCKQRLIIPNASGQRPERVADEPVDKGDPLPGFYKAAFADGWRLFSTSDGLAGLVFITAAVSFKFFLGHTDYSVPTRGFTIQLPTGWIITLLAWGGLFAYYLDVIESGTLDEDQLPEVSVGLWGIIKALWVFGYGLVVVLTPCILWLGVQHTLSHPRPSVTWVLANLGILLLPTVLLTFGVNRDVGIMARLDQMVGPAIRAFRPYLFVALSFLVVWNLQMLTRDYAGLQAANTGVVALHLAAQLAIQVLAIRVMRALGVFYRHYACYFAW